MGLTAAFPWHVFRTLPLAPPTSPPPFYLKGKRKSIAFWKIPSFNNLLSTYCVLAIIFGAEDTAIKQTSMSQGRTELVPGLPS